MYCRECGVELKKESVKKVNYNQFLCLDCGHNCIGSKNYCQKCGVETTENQLACKECKTILKYQNHIDIDIDDKLLPGLPFVTFFFPIIGLILYIVWRNEKPQAARDIANIAIISTIIFTSIGLLIFFIGIIASISA